MICLPYVSNVYDLFDDKPVGTQITEFSVDMPAKSTKLWRIEAK